MAFTQGILSYLHNLQHHDEILDNVYHNKLYYQPLDLPILRVIFAHLPAQAIASYLGIKLPKQEDTKKDNICSNDAIITKYLQEQGFDQNIVEEKLKAAYQSLYRDLVSLFKHPGRYHEHHEDMGVTWDYFNGTYRLFLKNLEIPGTYTCQHPEDTRILTLETMDELILVLVDAMLFQRLDQGVLKFRGIRSIEVIEDVIVIPENNPEAVQALFNGLWEERRIVLINDPREFLVDFPEEREDLEYLFSNDHLMIFRIGDYLHFSGFYEPVAFTLDDGKFLIVAVSNRPEIWEWIE